MQSATACHRHAAVTLHFGRLGGVRGAPPAGRNGRISGNESGQRPAGRRRDSRVVDIASGLPADGRRLRTHAGRHCRRGGGTGRRPLLAPPYPAAADASRPERNGGLSRGSDDQLVEARPPAASYGLQEPAGQERIGQERASKGARLSQRGPSRAAGARRLRIKHLAAKRSRLASHKCGQDKERDRCAATQSRTVPAENPLNRLQPCGDSAISAAATIS